VLRAAGGAREAAHLGRAAGEREPGAVVGAGVEQLRLIRALPLQLQPVELLHEHHHRRLSQIAPARRNFLLFCDKRFSKKNILRGEKEKN